MFRFSNWHIISCLFKYKNLEVRDGAVFFQCQYLSETSSHLTCTDKGNKVTSPTLKLFLYVGKDTFSDRKMGL